MFKAIFSKSLLGMRSSQLTAGSFQQTFMRNPVSFAATRHFHSSFSCQQEAKHPLSEETRAIIKATAPVLEEHGYAITRCMYQKMFNDHPELREMFNMTHQTEINDEKAHQPMSLACTTAAFAKYVDTPEVIGHVIERIAQKHISLHILPEQYGTVGENLLYAIKTTLGDAATPEIMKAWEEGYGFLAKVFIDRETQIRETAPWIGWKEFKVVKKVSESKCEDIRSFYMQPADGTRVPMHLPGQFIGIKVALPDNSKHSRNYTLSNGPGADFFRITVKREFGIGGGPHGLVSTHLHENVQEGDIVQLSVPCGTFTLKDNDKPIALVGAGVGLTPVVAMLEHCVRLGTSKHVTLVLASRGQNYESFHDYLSQIRRKFLNIKIKFIYSADEEMHASYPTGFLTTEHLKLAVPHKDSEWYICGPNFVQENLVKGLQEWGVPDSQISREKFGPEDP